MTPHSIGIISMNWQIDMSTTVNYKNLQWLYTRFAFDNKKDVVVTTATGNYDDKGGKLVSRQRYLCPALTGYFGWRLHDAHESNRSWVIVNQLVIK